MDVESLVAAGVVRRAKDGLRILGGGDFSAKISVTANPVTKSAREAIEKAGETSHPGTYGFRLAVWDIGLTIAFAPAP